MRLTENFYSVVGALLVLVVAVVGYALQRQRRQRRDAAALVVAREKNLHLPPSLHPVVDTDVCIGSLACIKACPEGDVIGVVDGAARLILGSNCIGHGRCAAECPVHAIRLVMGTSERGIDLPEVDPFYETSRPGVHIVGELGGMGLIKNAILQGTELAAHLGRTLQTVAGSTDVLVVGAGPAGLAAAVGLRHAGLSCRVLDQGTLGGTIAHYPRQKVVMTETVQLPGWGNFGKSRISKEDLLATLRAVLDKTRITVEEGVRVTGIEGADGAFTVATSAGPVAARKVVLATGRRGSPRTLDVPGELLPKVTYSLLDPEQYAGERVLVVGGGDSAVEAALALADHAREVTLSYRQPALGRCREANRQAMARAAEQGRVRLLFESQVREVRPTEVVMATPRGEVVHGNDFVIACLGGELPSAFLKSVGVDIRRYHGEEMGAPVPSRAPLQLRVPSKQEVVGAAPVAAAAASPARGARPAARRQSHRMGWVLLVVGLLITAGLAWVGGDYYLLPHALRRKATHHAFLKPAGLWGHGVGIVATLFMLSNFFYAARKRIDGLKGIGAMRGWLNWHVFVGLMSPVAIAFHAAFESNNLLATSTYLSLLVVVGSGIIGRYVFGLVPGAGGSQSDLAMLRAEMTRLRAGGGDHAAWPVGVEALWQRTATPPPEGGLLLGGLLAFPFRRLRDEMALLAARRGFTTGEAWREAREGLLRLERLRMQVQFYRGLKRFLSTWRVLHVVIAVLLVGVMSAHVAFSLYLGYRWIFA